MRKPLVAGNWKMNGSRESIEALLVRHSAQISGCALILLHWDEARQRILQRLRDRGVPVIAIIVRSEPRPADLVLPPRTYWVEAGKVEAQLPKDEL